MYTLVNVYTTTTGGTLHVRSCELYFSEKSFFWNDFFALSDPAWYAAAVQILAAKVQLFQFVFIKFYKITETSGNTTSEPPEGKESQNSIVVNFGKNIILKKMF